MRSTKPYCQLGGLYPFAMELGNCDDQGCSCNKLLGAMQYKGLRMGLHLLTQKTFFEKPQESEPSANCIVYLVGCQSNGCLGSNAASKAKIAIHGQASEAQHGVPKCK